MRKALILAAGEGTRLRPLTTDQPKPMLPVGGKPVLEHTINWLRSYGVEQIAINLHHCPNVVKDRFRDGRCLDVSIVYSMEEEILGTAGGARRLQSFLDDTFAVVYGDVVTDLDLRTLITRHESASGAASLALYRVPNPWECGIVEVDHAHRIRRFVEKPPRDAHLGDLASAGVLVLEPAVLKLIPADTFFDFGRDLFPIMLAQGWRMFGWPIASAEYLLDMGSLEKYKQLQEDFKSGRWRPVEAR